MENDFFYSPDVYERETSDRGFSNGWGMHFKACPDYYFDSHCHFMKSEESCKDIIGVINNHNELLDQFNVNKALLLFKVYDSETGWIPESETGDIFSIEMILKCKDYFSSQSRFYWAPYLRYKDPNIKLIDKCIEAGASCIKLHNAHLIMDAGDPEIWLSDNWAQVFKRIEESGLPVLWHVTQRTTACQYRGMGANSYWKVGIPKGISYGNQELLDIFLNIVEKYPKINFIGAHQLHIGWEKIEELFCRYDNLFIDTSTGCFLRPDDDFYDKDQTYLREFFIKHSKRILFATDLLYKNPKEPEWKLKYEYKGHIRFINKLNLPNDVLQEVSHKNAERLYRIN